MLINGIEYFVSIFVKDASADSFVEGSLENIIENYDFHNFEEFNQFVRDNKDNPKYKDCKFSYSFVESIDGEPSYFTWDKDIEFKEFTDEEIEKEIEEYILDEEEVRLYWEKVTEFSKQIHYRGDDEECLSKRVRLKDYSYVCPRCLRTVDDCRCKFYSHYLVQIDTLILPIIRLLNEKGYKTTGCCAGHPEIDESEFLSSGISICFDRDYDFDWKLPEGSKYSKIKHCISFTPTPADLDDLKYFQSRVLDDLMEWADLLDEVEYEFDNSDE